MTVRHWRSATVIGGTLDLDGELRVRVTKVGEETFLSQIVRLMTNIAERKPPLELLADRLMNYYGPVVFVVAGLAFGGWLAVTGDPMRAALVLLTTIIMGYPCALGITTPMLAAIAGGKGISVGLLVKASEVFYGLSITDTVVFDKTGTLTYGRPTVTDLVAFGTSRDDVLSFAAAVEASSEHPLGQAIAFFAQHPEKQLVIRAHPGETVLPGLLMQKISEAVAERFEIRSRHAAYGCRDAVRPFRAAAPSRCPGCSRWLKR